MKPLFHLLTYLTLYSSSTTASTLPPLPTNSIKFLNNCPYDLYYWTIGPRGSHLLGPDSSHTRIPAHNTLVQPMINTEHLHGGIVLKLRDYPAYNVKPAGIIQVEYNLLKSSNRLWYDLSVIDCDRNAGPMHPSFCPLIDGGVKLSVPDALCPSAWCSCGRCENVYLKHGSWHNEPSFMCKAGVQVVLETCTESVGPKTFQADWERKTVEEMAGVEEEEEESGVTAAGGKKVVEAPYGILNSTASVVNETVQAPYRILNSTIPVVNLTLNATPSARTILT